MNGKQIGTDHAAKINVILNEMRDACAGDPQALIEAASVVSHLLSLSNEDAPATQVVRQMRRDAILAMHAEGMSDQKIADRIGGMSRSRVQQLRTTTSEGARKSETTRGRTSSQPVKMDTLPGFYAA